MWVFVGGRVLVWDFFLFVSWEVEIIIPTTIEVYAIFNSYALLFLGLFLWFFFNFFLVSYPLGYEKLSENIEMLSSIFELMTTYQQVFILGLRERSYFSLNNLKKKSCMAEQRSLHDFKKA